jgi:hypothetical protein
VRHRPRQRPHPYSRRLDLAAGGLVDPARVVSTVLDWEQLPEALLERHLKPVFVRDLTKE